MLRFLKTDLRWTLLVSVLVAFGAWVAGPARYAVWIRRTVASGARWVADPGPWALVRAPAAPPPGRAGSAAPPAGSSSTSTGCASLGVIVAALFLVFGGNLTGWSLLVIVIVLAVYLGLLQLVAAWARKVSGSGPAGADRRRDRQRRPTRTRGPRCPRARHSGQTGPEQDLCPCFPTPRARRLGRWQWRSDRSDSGAVGHVRGRFRRLVHHVAPRMTATAFERVPAGAYGSAWWCAAGAGARRQATGGPPSYSPRRTILRGSASRHADSYRAFMRAPVACDRMSVRWRIGLVAVIAAAVVGGFLPHGFLPHGVLSAADTRSPRCADGRSPAVGSDHLPRCHLRQGQPGTGRALAGRGAGGGRGGQLAAAAAAGVHPPPAPTGRSPSPLVRATPCSTRLSSPSSTPTPRRRVQLGLPHRVRTSGRRRPLSTGGRSRPPSRASECARAAPARPIQGEQHVEVPIGAVASAAAHQHQYQNEQAQHQPKHPEHHDARQSSTGAPPHPRAAASAPATPS